LVVFFVRTETHPDVATSESIKSVCPGLWQILTMLGWHTITSPSLWNERPCVKLHYPVCGLI